MCSVSEQKATQNHMINQFHFHSTTIIYINPIPTHTSTERTIQTSIRMKPFRVNQLILLPFSRLAFSRSISLCVSVLRCVHAVHSQQMDKNRFIFHLKAKIRHSKQMPCHRIGTRSHQRDGAGIQLKSDEITAHSNGCLVCEHGKRCAFLLCSCCRSMLVAEQ